MLNMELSFIHISLQLPEPSFGSPLTDTIIDLDYLRKKQITGTTPPHIFFQLKEIFHTLESIGSARIEGNHTTVAEFIETKIADGQEEPTDPIREILNMERAMDFIEEYIKSNPINRAFISEVHKMIVRDLKREGDVTPGEYRKKNVKITGSPHVPPDFIQVDEYMEELFNFISKEDAPKYDLLKTAVAHHRFAWIHPFGNGNGRTVRLLTYAMLVQQGFNVEKGRIINPTAIFCSNRNQYYLMLGKADTGTTEGMLEWCYYVLSGLRTEIEKVDLLTQYDFLKERILIPTINSALQSSLISEVDAKILILAADKMSVMAGDLKPIIGNKLPQEVSRILRKMRERRLLMPVKEGARKYVIHFSNSFLLRGVIQMLDKNGFLPLKDESK
jgi:Fic family protein